MLFLPIFLSKRLKSKKCIFLNVALQKLQFLKCTPISPQVVLVTWKTSTGVCFTTTCAKKKKKSNETTKKQLKMLLLTSPKMELGKNCAMFIVYDAASLVRKIKTDTTN